VERVAAQHPSVTTAWVDAGYKQSVIDVGAAHGIDVQVVTKVVRVCWGAAHTGKSSRSPADVGRSWRR